MNKKDRIYVFSRSNFTIVIKKETHCIYVDFDLKVKCMNGEYFPREARATVYEVCHT